MASFKRTFVLLRPLAVKSARGTDPLRANKIQYVQGYEVREDVGENGGIILDEVTMTDHPNYPITGSDGTKEWVSRKILRTEMQWSPTSCSHCGIALDEDYIDVESQRPKRHVCKECHRPITWTSRRVFYCEPVRWDVERILASVATVPEWSWVEVRSADQLAIYTGGAPEDPAWSDAQGDDAADDAEARAEGTQSPKTRKATDQDARFPDGWRALQERVKALLENGAPKDELSHGLTSPTAELEAFVQKYKEAYADSWTGTVPVAP